MTGTVKKIMVAVDFSDYSAATVSYAANLARDLGAGLLLVNVINQRDVDFMKMVANHYPDFPVSRYHSEKETDRKEGLKNMIKEAGCEDLRAEASVRSGIPHKELLLEIKEKEADLLVMGTKGRSNLVDAIVGSCARKMFRQSMIPVLSFRSSGR